MKPVVKTLFVLSLPIISMAAHAQIYMCKDAGGHTLTSDRPIPECSDRGVKVLGSSGAVKTEIAPPLTAEQMKQKRAEEDKRKADEAAAEVQRRQDSALLARYRTEEDLEIARKRTLELLQVQINREKTNLVTKEKNLNDTKAEISSAVDVSKKTQKPLPPALMRKLEDSEQSVRASKKVIADKEAELAQLNAKFDQSLKRLRELNAEAHGTAAAGSAAAVVNSSTVSSK